MYRLTISHLKNRFFVQSQGGPAFQTGGILQYFEDLKRGPNTGFGSKDIFEIASTYFAVAFLTSVVFLLSGCGVKGSPVPPVYAKPPAVSDLQYQVEGRQLSLTWSVPPMQPTDNVAIAGAKVFRLKLSLKKVPCQDCPRTFTLMGKIPIRSGTMQFQDTMDKGFEYYYKIVLYDAGNHDGEDSNIVHVRIK
jgi:hypothetical protein